MNPKILPRTALALLLLLAIVQTDPVRADDLVVTNVNIVDVDAGTRALRTVVISAGRIAQIGARDSVRPPPRAQILDAGGRYLIPALWDMHIHPMEVDALAMLVANGVGGARIMWGLPHHLQWRARIELGELPGPRLLIAGPIIEGAPPPHLANVVDTDGRRLVKTRADGVAEVRRQKAAGFDYIKVYNNVPLEAYEGVIAEAEQLRIPVVGHVPFAAGLRGALAARQTSIEHLRGYIEQLVPAQAPIEPGIDFRSRALAWEYIDAARIPEVVKATREAGVWQCPTLGTNIYHAPARDIERYLASPEAEYLDPQTREGFRHREQVKWLSNFSEADFERATRANDKQAALVRAMHVAGVPLLAGTDSNAFGFALHRELEALVAAGLTAHEALRAATINPARFARLDSDMGRVAAGFAADLILLDADPLQDIRNTRRIHAVILRGKLLDRSRLDDMLMQVKRRLATGSKS